MYATLTNGKPATSTALSGSQSTTSYPASTNSLTEGNLLFICEVGARSGLAAEYAAAMGADTSRLYNIEDGTPAWIANGLPHATGA